MGMTRRWPLALLPLLTAASHPPAWTRPTAPVHLIGPIYYVGSEGLASYLIRTPAGAILIDGTMAENVAAIRANIERVGVPIRDVRLLLVTHAHFDHAAGDAAMKRATGARLVAGARDRVALEAGTPPGENISGSTDFPAVAVDRGVRDGDVVRLGGVTLVARATPGHTPGCTSWTMRIVEQRRPLDVVFPCSTSVAGNRLIGNRRYPGIVADYRASFRMLAGLPADVVLPAHPELAAVMTRKARGTLIAPGLLRKLALQSRSDFDRELAAQRANARP